MLGVVLPVSAETTSLRELTSPWYLQGKKEAHTDAASGALKAGGANQLGDTEIEELRALIRDAQKRSLDLLPEMKTFATDTTEQSSDQYGRNLLPGDDDTEQILIFASDSMSKVDLAEMMQAATHRPDVTIVFRGIHPDETITQAYARIQRSILRAGVEEHPPNVIIDPRLFRQFGVNAAPEILLARGRNALVRAQGTYAVQWLETRYESGRVGDLGAFGTVHQIVEPDFLQMVQARLEKLDLEAMKRNAVKRFWEHQTFVELEPAPESGTRYLDPTIINPYAITDTDDNVLIPAGTRINPLENMPFDWRVMVFDPSRSAEVEFVRAWLGRQPETQRVQLIATRLLRDTGWEALRELEEGFERPVYLLTGDVKERFGLRYTPSELRAQEKLFVVEETHLAEAH
jgi:conjugal transfer pilus assembly protein TraW